MDTLLLLIIAGLLWRNLNQPSVYHHPTTRSWLQEPLGSPTVSSPEQRISQLRDQAMQAMVDEVRRSSPGQRS